MKIPIKLMLTLALALAAPVYADNPPSAREIAASKTVDFISDVSKYQGMFDSVIEFCRPHAPARILDFARNAWLSKNQHYLDLRDRELARFVLAARKNGATPEQISNAENWLHQQYEEARHNNRMYKDLLIVKDLRMACSKRLGEMNSVEMSLQVLRPKSAEYAKGVEGP